MFSAFKSHAEDFTAPDFFYIYAYNCLFLLITYKSMRLMMRMRLWKICHHRVVWTHQLKAQMVDDRSLRA